MSTPKKLFVLDAMALIYRAHFAFSKNPRVTSAGLNTSAVFGFTNTLWEVISKEKPTHIAVAFDTPEDTFRHDNYSEYKANRQEQPEDITLAIPLVKKLLKCFNIPVLEIPGYEADDVAGTLAKYASANGYKVYLMTMDKDYCQLVNENVFLYKPSYIGTGYETYDVARVLEKFGVERVEQVIDILGLMGDSVDNIPGIPGIGEKTAQKLIAEFGSVENLIANADKLKGKQKENVINFAQQGLMSKELATIHCEVPIVFTEEELFYDGPDKEKLSALFDELEFRNMKKRIIGDEFADETPAAATPKASTKASKKGDQSQMSLFGGGETTVIIEVEEEDEIVGKNYDTVQTVLHDYHTIDTPELRQSLIGYLKQQSEFCFDTETTSLDAVGAELVGLAFSYYEKEAYYVPIPADRAEAQKIINEFKGVLEDESIVKIGQNLKYDVLVLKNYGIEVKGKIFDTMLAHYLIEPDKRHGMDILSETYLNYSPISIENLIGKKSGMQGNMRDVAIEKISEYAAEDADVTYQLKNIFEPILKQHQLEKLFTQVENPLIDVLADMEYAGVKIDPSALKDFSGELAKEVLVIEKSIYDQAGVQFNIASPKQLGDVLFEKLKLDPKAKKTRTGQYATGEEILSRLAYEHKIAADILDYRELQKLKSTYVDTLPTLISKVDQRVHTSYNQAVAATGRLSSTNPNLQNIPIRTDRGKEIRKAFVRKDENHLILSADYSQIELRIMAAFSKEENMINSFKNGIDIHSTTASKVFKVELEAVTSDMRRKSKMVNFGIIYGISAFGLAQRLDIPRKEAAEIIESYFEQFPAIKVYMDEIVNSAREMGFVETIMGRRRYLPDITSGNATLRGYAERNAINAPIQGSAADMIKVAMINIHDWMKKEKLQSQMVMQVHDELVFDVHQSELEIMKLKIAEYMKTAIDIGVPMEIGVGVGENWLEAH
ncbi:MAG TPA: DNA polymerase I [Cytophagaceae bacterium]|nr:DNA polymerase I [Cytophagaceae bacterium]